MLIQFDKWTIQDMALDEEKILTLWSMLQRHKPLFSDLTQGDFPNFVRCITDPYTMWFEVRVKGILVGIIWFGEMQQEIDVQGHMMFFDRKPAEKLGVCQQTIRWMFDNFPIQRISVEIPAVIANEKHVRSYASLNRLLVKMGLVFEGKKREAVLIGGQWRDVLLFGVTRKECVQWAS